MHKFSRVSRLAIAALAVGAVLCSFNGNAGAESAEDLAPVDIVAVSGLIDNVVVAEIEHALVRSQENGAQAVVLQVNSRGAVVSPERMAELLTKIADAEIPVAVWVGPTGARAYGLSAQLLAVADVRAMAPGARIGFTGQALKVNGTEISFGAIGAVLRTSTIGFTEARKEGVLNYAGDDQGVPVVRNMLLALDGVKVGNTELNTVVEKVDSSGQIVRDATAARFFKLELTGQLMHTVASPPVAYLLFAIGLALLVFEFFTAGIGIAGVVGAICAMLGTYGLASLPVRGWAVALIVLALVAFAVDVQVGVPRFWTGVGLVMFVVAPFECERLLIKLCSGTRYLNRACEYSANQALKQVKRQLKEAANTSFGVFTATFFYCSLISTSTPAGKSNFISASTVLSVGSTMSIRRWCVRISN